MTISVLCALRGSIETATVRGLSGSTQLQVTRRCADLTELLAAAAAGLGQVAVVSTDLPGLDRAAVAHLRGSGLRVVAVADPDRGWPADRVLALGVDAALAQDALEDVATVVAAVTQRSGSAADAAPAASAAAAGRPASSSSTTPATSTGDTRPGTLVAVWGPTGAPGRTTVAVNLAAELAEHGSLLVDADTYGGTIAQLLGMLDEAPGIAAATRAAATGRLDAGALALLTPVLDGGMRVLTGLSRADRWPEVPASHLEPVWAAARELSPWTVVDCGFSLEQDEALLYDTRAPRRNGATLSALEAADVVVVVGGGDPIGLQRLIRALSDLAEVGLATTPVVVVNAVRASASGPRPADAITDALRRYAGVTAAHLVPDDRAGCDGAVLNALTLREHAPSSPARRAIAGLADALVADLAGQAH